MKPTNLYTVALVIAATVAAVLVVVLALEKRTLERRVEGLSGRLRDPYTGFLVPPVTVGSLSSDSLTLGGGEPGQLQLLFVFATGCDPCVASVPAWKAIRNEVEEESRIQVVGLVVDSGGAAQDYITHHGIDFPVATFTDRRLRALYRTRRVPQVLLLDAVGRVRYARFGALAAPEALDSVRAVISAALIATKVALDDTGRQAPR